jgi:hypothetical protein
VAHFFSQEIIMKTRTLVAISLMLPATLLGVSLLQGTTEAQDDARKTWPRQVIAPQVADVEILVAGRPLEEYHARGKTYVEAAAGAEYEVLLRNPWPYRVAVALSVDGLNSIDARRTSAWNASKWVLGPYETIHVGGWQMSSSRARRFYFTTERDSYASKLGQTANVGVVSAVFFREVQPRPITITPTPHPPYEKQESRKQSDRKSGVGEPSTAGRNEPMVALPDDEYAATGIGRSVQNDVRWISMELDSRAVGEVTIRYEYYPALVRLGVLPRRYPDPDPLRRREDATGFENRRFSPEP